MQGNATTSFSILVQHWPSQPTELHRPEKKILQTEIALNRMKAQLQLLQQEFSRYHTNSFRERSQMENIPLKQIPLTITIESRQLLITTEKSCTSERRLSSSKPGHVRGY